MSATCCRSMSIQKITKSPKDQLLSFDGVDDFSCEEIQEIAAILHNIATDNLMNRYQLMQNLKLPVNTR